MSVKYSIWTIIIAVIFGSNLVYAIDANPIHYQIKPDSIMREIDSRGAKVVCEELYSDWNVWYSILQKKIASGDESWLKTAVALRPGSDAGATEMLDLAVGEALEHNPVNVFRFTLKVFPIHYICGAPDYNDPRFNSYDLAMKAINLRIHIVSSMRNIENSVTECIQYLETSKEEISHFYKVNK